MSHETSHETRDVTYNCWFKKNAKKEKEKAFGPRSANPELIHSPRNLQITHE